MKTQKVKALDLVKYPLPIIIKGIKGVYEITKVVTENDRVTCYRTASHGREIATLRKPYDGVFEVVLTESNVDHLLNTVGALHTRNKGLQKGHATLTRRVQELEGILAEKEHMASASLSDRAIDAIIADVMKPELQITAADVRLQDDIEKIRTRHVREREEWTQIVKDLDSRLNALESRTPSPKDFGNAIHEAVERMLQPGGLLYRGLK